jgi:hypothetical protein
VEGLFPGEWRLEGRSRRGQEQQQRKNAKGAKVYAKGAKEDEADEFIAPIRR